MIDAHDDLATAKRPYRVVACMAVKGRRPLLKYTIERLYKKNGVYKVVCAGDDPGDHKVCEEAGAVWMEINNHPLGRKWNRAFEWAAKFDPDACLFVGSSDWLSDNWIPVMRPYLDRSDLIGTAGMYLVHLAEEKLMCHWPGYTNHRRGESIGIGRMINRMLLDRLQFKPFNDAMPSSLDGSMIQNCTRHAARIQLVDRSELKSLSISTNLWGNMHNFFDHYGGKLPSEKMYEIDNWLENNFPEALKVCESLKDMSVSQ